MVELSGLVAFVAAWVSSLNLRIREMLLPSSPANQLSFEPLQIPAPSIFFHPENSKHIHQSNNININDLGGINM